MGRKKTIKTVKTVKTIPEQAEEAVKTLKAEPTVNLRLEYFKKKLEEAKKTGPLTKIDEYRFWVETMEGKTPAIPKHMR